MQSLPEALAPLKAYNQFVLWKLVPATPKPKKLLFNPLTLEMASSTDPTTWTDADTAVTVAGLLDGEYNIGFVLTEHDPFFLLDIDDCLQADNQWSQLATQLCTTFAGAAVELSQSGKGLHIIGSGAIPPHGCKNTALGLELYHTSRFIALTGNDASGSVEADMGHQLIGLIADYFQPSKTITSEDWRNTAVDDWDGPEDDAELIAKAMSSVSAASAFGNKASFKDLWENNEQALAAAFPSQNNIDPYDRSSADASLTQRLAFWTGNNHERIARIMRQSALVRPKWDRNKKYMTRTVSNAVSRQTDVYGVKPKPVPMPPNEGELSDPFEKVSNDQFEVREGFQFLGVADQHKRFKGCIYVQEQHRVFTPDGSMLKPDQFKATYGSYLFALDMENKTTKNAFEVFTESQATWFPKAQNICFRPDMPSGEIIKEEGRTLINTYVPVIVKRQKGDASPFLNHLTKVLPIEHDAQILLSYMAAIVQHIGVKFQWTPLIQGVEGNGKSLFIRCMEAALGKRYTHIPNASDIANKFNYWIMNKLFIGVEEVYTKDKQEVLEVLKPMITNDRIEIQAKGMDQFTGDNRANFIMTTNHADAIRKTTNDRRFCIFYSAQQQASDLERDGLTKSYFNDLYTWLRGGGYAIVTDYLMSYTIPDELNPATQCSRAPDTSSTEEVLRTSMGAVEQEIMEAVSEGRQGFMNGWVSSFALDALLVSINKKITRNKRAELMKDLRYIKHPGLKDGRVNNPMGVQAGKPVLYIKAGHIHANLTSSPEISKQYVAAQNADTPKASHAFKNEDK